MRCCNQLTEAAWLPVAFSSIKLVLQTTQSNHGDN